MSTDTPTTPVDGAVSALVILMNAHQPGRMPSSTDPVALSRYLAHDFPRELRRAEEAIADALPALTPDAFVKACNGDHSIEGEVTRWRDGRWSLVDVSELRASEPVRGLHGRECAASSDPEAWTILRGSSRFEVREVPRLEVRRTGGAGKVEAWVVWNNETNEEADTSDADSALGFDPSACAYGEGEAHDVARWLTSNAPGCDDTVYVVVDTDERDPSTSTGYATLDHGSPDYGPEYDPTDESDAQNACEIANREDYEQNAAGWPFAHNYAAAIDERDADDFAACGFVVATHEPSGQVYAGIDGGGYSFIVAYWAPLYLRFHLYGMHSPGYIYVPTRDGLRRVVNDAIQPRVDAVLAQLAKE